MVYEIPQVSEHINDSQSPKYVDQGFHVPEQFNQNHFTNIPTKPVANLGSITTMTGSAPPPQTEQEPDFDYLSKRFEAFKKK